MVAAAPGWYHISRADVPDWHRSYGQPGITLKGRRTYMATVLSKALKRALNIGGADYVLTITPEGFTLTPKGKRKGQSWTWSALLSGEAGLTASLNASMHQGDE